MEYPTKVYAVELVGGLATVLFAIFSLLILLAWASAGMEILGGNAAYGLQVIAGTLVFTPLLAPYLWLRFKSDAWPGPYTQRLIDAVS